MKKKTIMLVVLAVVMLGVVIAQEPVKEAVEDLRDKLFQPSASTYEKYGWGDNTLRLWNLVVLRRVCENQEQRILALEAQVAALVKPDEAIFNINEPAGDVIEESTPATEDD